jgi:hypothetical protein
MEFVKNFIATLNGETLVLYVFKVAALYVGVSALNQLVRNIIEIVRLHFFYQTTREEINPDATPKPAHYESVVNELNNAGLRLLRASSNTSSGSKTQTIGYVFVSNDGLMFVDVIFDVYVPVFIGAGSLFSDESLVMTRFPHAPNIETTNFSVAFVRRSIPLTLQYHRQRVAEWAKHQGDPIIITTSEQIDHISHLYDTRYRRLETNAFLGRQLLVTTTILVVVLFATLLAIAPVSEYETMLFWIVSLLVAILVKQRVSKWAWQQYLQPKGALDDALPTSIEG